MNNNNRHGREGWTRGVSFSCRTLKIPVSVKRTLLQRRRLVGKPALRTSNPGLDCSLCFWVTLLLSNAAVSLCCAFVALETSNQYIIFPTGQAFFLSVLFISLQIKESRVSKAQAKGVSLFTDTGPA